MQFTSYLSLPLSLLAFTTLISALPQTPTSFDIVLNGAGPIADMADGLISKRDGPGVCEDVCPAGSPRVASCSYTHISETPHCFCAGNALECTPRK